MHTDTLLYSPSVPLPCSCWHQVETIAQRTMCTGAVLLRSSGSSSTCWTRTALSWRNEVEPRRHAWWDRELLHISIQISPSQSQTTSSLRLLKLWMSSYNWPSLRPRLQYNLRLPPYLTLEYHTLTQTHSCAHLLSHSHILVGIHLRPLHKGWHEQELSFWAFLAVGDDRVADFHFFRSATLDLWKKVVTGEEIGEKDMQ